MSGPARSGMPMTVLRRPDSPAGPHRVTVVGVLSSHSQAVVSPLPDALRVVSRNESARPPVALDVRALHETTEQRLIVAVPVRRRKDGRWVRIAGRTFMAGGSYVVADDSRMSEFLRDASGYAYDPAVPLHDRTED